MDSTKLKKINYFYSLDGQDVYKHIGSSKQNPEIAEFIHQNFNTLDESDMVKMVLKFLSPNEMKHILLKYELKNWSPIEKNMSLNEFTQQTQKILYRYQSRAGGFLIEDRHWTLHTSESSKYHLHDNQVIFENTISAEFINDPETREYIQNILSLLNRMTKNVRVKVHTYLSERDNLYWIIFKCKEPTIK